MLQTDYGSFDGDRWERICQICFKQKYESEVYMEIKATPGDFGIEGFTRQGQAFQCYCPDENYTREELYEKQRDKITDDLKKLKTFELQLKKRLDDTKIRNWYFVTPDYSRNEIVAHCTKKRDEIRALDWDIIDSENFEVIPTDIDFLLPYLANSLEMVSKKINLMPNKEVEESDKLKWKDQEINLVENAQRKHSLRFPEDANNLEKKIDDLTETSVKNFLNGNIILKKWETEYPEDFEKFIQIKSLVEDKVIEDSMFQVGDNNQRLKEIESDLSKRIKENFPFLDQIMIERLCNQVLSDWILRCPIDFEQCHGRSN